MRGTAPLRLERFIPIKDVRKLIWRYLNVDDRTVAWAATTNQVRLRGDFAMHCIDHGYLELLQWGYEHGCSITSFEQGIGAARGHLDIVIYMDSLSIRNSKLCHRAAYGGRLDILKWGLDHGYRWEMTDSLAMTAYYGHVHVLEYALQKGASFYAEVFTYAAKGGHLECVIWLHSVHCPWDFRVCVDAATGGHLEIIRFAHLHGCPWSSEVCARAAKYGHFEVLKWARDHQCPWNSDTTFNAAHSNDIDILDWAYAQGCPMDERLRSVKFWFSKELIEWLQMKDFIQ